MQASALLSHINLREVFSALISSAMCTYGTNFSWMKEPHISMVYWLDKPRRMLEEHEKSL